MKTTLTFSLPEEELDLKTALAAPSLVAVCYGFVGWIRQQQKYAGVETVELEAVRIKFRELLESEGVPEEVLYG